MSTSGVPNPGEVTVRFEEMHKIEAGVVTFGVIHREFTEASLQPYLGSPGVDEILERIRDDNFWDQGVSIYVYEAGTNRDHLRFDCLEVEPHYHYHRLHAFRDAGIEIEMAYQHIKDHADSVIMNGYWHQVPYDVASNGDMRAWALDRLRRRLAEMLVEAGQPALAAGLDSALINHALDQLEPYVYAAVTRD